jgi:hypothetical protein
MEVGVDAENAYDKQPETWKEFKELVEKQMKEKGIPEDVKLWYIDLSFPDNVDVFMQEGLGMCI